MDAAMLSREVVDSLFDGDLPEVEEWQSRYPERELREGARVTRFAPSPTGSLHIGGVYVAMIAKDVAHASAGRYFVRIEDTDRARLVPGAEEQFARAFGYFGIEPDADALERWGPARQSERSPVYLSFVRQLLRDGAAYPCFCTREELADLAERQRVSGTAPGYYGRWARCRALAPDDVTARLSAGNPYVVRFRVPEGLPTRIRYRDLIRGDVELENNRNDAVVLKSSAEDVRLPTYHFAHVVDDSLMRVTTVIRGEEWISSVPLHLQLLDALAFPAFDYAHIAPLMKQQGGSRRKLSKRKDPEASVDFYLSTGYPAPPVLHYLRGLANGRLAEVSLEEALATPVRLEDCGTYGPLLDVDKLDHLARNYIAGLPGEDLLAQLRAWAAAYDPDLVPLLDADPAYSRTVVDVERVGVDNPRKDLGRWADFREYYAFFFAPLFELVTDPSDERLGGLAPDVVQRLAAELLADYQDLPEQPEWFAQVRDAAARAGFAPDAKTYKQDPAAYPGAIREAATVVRVALTGSRRSPDLHAVAHALGEAEVRRRLEPLAGVAGPAAT